jgi:hypothetical protein
MKAVPMPKKQRRSKKQGTKKRSKSQEKSIIVGLHDAVKHVKRVAPPEAQSDFRHLLASLEKKIQSGVAKPEPAIHSKVKQNIRNLNMEIRRLKWATLGLKTSQPRSPSSHKIKLSLKRLDSLLRLPGDDDIDVP